MSTKRYNTKTFDFVVNGEHVYFTCDTTNINQAKTVNAAVAMLAAL